MDAVIGVINQIIATQQSESATIQQFANLFDRYADLGTISSYALGVDSRRATAPQLAAFGDAFAGYMARKYGRRFREFIGGRIEVQGSRAVRSWIEVATTAILRGQAPFRVDFHVSDNTGRDLFFNIVIEGVNLLLTEREEIGAMLDQRRGDIDAMIADLNRAG